MPVVADSCQIYNPAMVGSQLYASAYRVRRLTGLPFGSIFERDLAVIGTVLGFDELPCPINATGIYFQSQGEGKGTRVFTIHLTLY
jgi:hypothetical protein